MQRLVVDKLIDFCENHADKIAEQWYKALSTNARTTSFRKLSRDGCVRHAMTFYKNMRSLFLADNCFEAVRQIMDVNGFVEDFFARGIPPEEVVYALVMMRRHIWLYAESQALFNMDVVDMYNAVNSTTRILLIFDYATYLTVKEYPELAAHKLI
jgi:hypothetical protein